MDEKFPTTLAGLCAQLEGMVRRRTPQPVVLDYLHRMASRYNFRLRYDEYVEGEYDDEVVQKHFSDYIASLPPAQPERSNSLGGRKEKGGGAKCQITFEEYMEKLKRSKALASKTRAQPDDAGDDSGKAAAAPASSSTREPQPAGRRGRKPVEVHVKKGRMFVKVDPAIRDPRDPPRGRAGGKTAAAASEAGGKTAAAASEAENIYDYLPASGKLVGRVLIYRDARGIRPGRRTVPIMHEFGSATFDAITWRVLAVTPRPFTRDINYKEVDAHIEDKRYQVVKTNDGSLGTLYRWTHPRAGPIWCMATQKAYDIFPLDWAGNFTWAEGFFPLIAPHLKCELRKEYLCSGDCRVEFADLPPDSCYTIGFRGHAMQPLLADPEGAWFVQSVSTARGSDFQPSFSPTCPQMGALPSQTLLTLDQLRDAIASVQESPHRPAVSVKGLELLCGPSISTAISAISQGLVGFEHVHYGYILRSVDIGKTGPTSSDIIIESPLLRKVRHHMYSQPRRDDLEHVTPDLKVRYNAIRALLSSESNREMILGLYPQFSELDGKVREFLMNVRHEILARARREALTAQKRPANRYVSSMAAAVLAAIQNKHPNFGPFEGSTAEAIVDGYLYDSVNAVLLLRVLGYLH